MTVLYFVYFQLYDKINTKSVCPSNPPNADAVFKAKEVRGQFCCHLKSGKTQEQSTNAVAVSLILALSGVPTSLSGQSCWIVRFPVGSAKLTSSLLVT